jgi:hypothetical protein
MRELKPHEIVTISRQGRVSELSVFAECQLSDTARNVAISGLVNTDRRFETIIDDEELVKTIVEQNPERFYTVEIRDTHIANGVSPSKTHIANSVCLGPVCILLGLV